MSDATTVQSPNPWLYRGVALSLGAAFGFVLSRAGATTPDFYAQLFLFEHFQLMWVIAAAAAVGVVGVALMRRYSVKTLLGGTPIPFKPKPNKKGLVLGSLLFGLGWGFAGACPGTALAMLGEGRLLVVATLVGILVGTWLYGLGQPREEVCSPSDVEAR